MDGGLADDLIPCRGAYQGLLENRPVRPGGRTELTRGAESSGCKGAVESLALVRVWEGAVLAARSTPDTFLPGMRWLW
jgi:hypothetical protein